MASTRPDDVKGQATSLATQVERLIKKSAMSEVHPARRIANVLGSLQLALSAGAIFTVSMIIGTMLESWYSASIAQELIYNSWWFILLLGLLGTCIFFAAVKKWPWKKHQTGFLITHVGLLTLLAGGVLNTFYGLDATMTLVDNREFAESNGIRQRSNEVFLIHDSVLVLTRQMPDKEKDGEMKEDRQMIPISPGPIPWGTPLAEQVEVPTGMKFLTMLAHPWSRAISTQLYPDLKFEVLGYLPHTRIEPLEEAKPKEFGFPAIKLEVSTRDGGNSKPEWMALTTERKLGLRSMMGNVMGGMLVEFLGKCNASLIDEFTKPPAMKERGKRGQLVFWHEGAKYRIDVGSSINKTVPLGTKGWQVKVESYQPWPGSKKEDDTPDLPTVNFQVIAPDGKSTKYQVVGRLAMYAGPLDHLETPMEELPAGLPAVWYHPPDLRYGYDGATPGSPRLRMMLQFVQRSDGKLYYRTLLEEQNEMAVEEAGEAPAEGLSKQIWDRHAGSFIIEEYLPHAKPCQQRVMPITRRPGLMSDENPGALLCRVTLTKKASNGESQSLSTEKWVPLHQNVVFTVQGKVGDEMVREAFDVAYSFKRVKLGFSLELTRAESQLDPGTTRSATFSSFVKLYDDKANIFGKDHLITMNEPLQHKGYRVFQSQFDTVGIDPASKKPIARSGFTIGYDPGIWLKFLGTGMLGLGIATMYYMKAYFFTGKKRV